MTEQKKEFQEAIKSLDKKYNLVTPNLSPFGVRLASTVKDNRLFVELRKTWTVDLRNPKDKNKLFLKKLLNIGFSGKPIIAEVFLECKDPFRQKLKLKQEGIL